MTQLDQTIARLAHLPPSPNPVISCFVNTGPSGGGRPTFMTFLRKAFAERLRSFPERADAVRHVEADRDRIFGFLSGELDSTVQSVAIHASDADDLWEAQTFRTPFDQERLVVGPVPHLYPLVKLADQSPLYAVCVADSNQARLVVCGLGAVLTEEDFDGPEPIDRTRVAGWAEVRYQARIEDHIQKNAREIVERLGKIVERGEVDYVILGGDDPILGELRRHLTPAIREKLIDEEHISIDAGAHEILKRTLQVVRDTEARESRQLADTVIDRFLAGGLAVAGLEPTLEALNLEQVDQLLLSENFNGDHAGWQCAHCRVLGLEPMPGSCPFCEAPMPERVELREAMVRRAERTGRKVEIVESHAGLEALDGVGATLRYRV
ncbi:MAG TPA: Vms1/Ankzf1 family peptidyl-tRNA hydrolase [Gemmatimonadota bacterium]|nr:Vms1/Ankzf1 family peptidyl-tRNA hydrolase [Gemmatimonadota bacterium]